MSADTFWHVAALLASVVGATWVLRKELSEIREALKVHITANDAAHHELDGRIIKLERRGKR